MTFMRHRARLLAVLMPMAAFFWLAGPARAADCGVPIIGPMADGLYFTPSPYTAAPTPDELCRKLQDASAAAAPVSDASSAPAVTTDPWSGAPIEAQAATSTAALGVDGVLPTPSLIAAVQRARQQLQALIDADAKKKTRIVTSTNVWVDVTLAVWNSKTDGIELVHAGKNGAKLDVDAGADVGLSVRYNNGVNSQFAVDDGDKIVVAVRYPIFKDVTVKRRHPRYELQDVVYSPNSDALRSPEMVAYGKQTLLGYIGAAYDALRASGVRSKAFPDKLVADVIDPDLVQSIAAIEHLGVGSLQGDGAQTALDSVYATVGANQDAAYAYARSSAGALGLVQFIPSTYALMAKRPDLGLTKDFNAGMTDPVNAFKAEIAYLDASLADMPLSVRDLYSVDPSRVDEYLAAAYNGGDIRVRRAIAAFGDDWSADPSARKAVLQKKYEALFSQAASLKKRILAENDPAVWKPMQKQLNASRAERAQVQAQMSKLTASSLRTETALYVQKLRSVLALLRPPAPPAPQA